MNKNQILEEIRRTAKENGGVPLGRLKFFTETGIKESDWRGRFWIRWNDAVHEAGFTPNQKTQAYDNDWLINQLIALTRELGHFPISTELRMKAHSDGDFPTDKTFRKFGSKNEMVSKVADFCRAHKGLEDVLALLPKLDEQPTDDDSDEVEVMGFVYLLKSGRFYKIGRSNAVGRRGYELAIQLPEKANIVHQIRTDDPAGIEDYWHRRFAAKRKNGEWFDLNSTDVKIMKRRKFM